MTLSKDKLWGSTILEKGKKFISFGNEKDSYELTMQTKYVASK